MEKIFQHIAPCRKAAQFGLGGGTVFGEMFAQLSHPPVKGGVAGSKTTVPAVFRKGFAIHFLPGARGGIDFSSPCQHFT
jgi:hypothetical protein